MKAHFALLLAFLLLAGCAVTPAVTTQPPETTQPTVTTAPPETTLPSEATAPPETTVPMDPTEAEVRAVVDAFLTAYEENCYLYTDNDYDPLTVLAAAPDATVTVDGKSVKLSSFHENIQARHDREDYWKQARQEQGISRSNFETFCHFTSLKFDGDTATVLVDFAMSFTYDDQPGTTSGSRDGFSLFLVQVDGAWLIADVTEVGG